MNENILTKEKMDGMKALAETNMKISEAKSILFKLQEDETSYLEIREKKSLDRIQKNLEDSKKLIEETKGNYNESHQIHAVASSLSDLIMRVFGKLRSSIEDFDQRQEDWEREIGRQSDEIADQRKEIKLESNRIENEKKNLKNKEIKLKEMESHLDSRQRTLETSYRIEKKLWDKINKK